MLVQKRDGSKEPLNIDKIHRMLELACDGLDVSMSLIETTSKLQFYDGVTTKYIQNVLIGATNKLIDLDTPDYQYVAARLLLFGLYKDLYPNWQTYGLGSLYQHLTRFKDKYDDVLYNAYTKEEWDVLDTVINHYKDYKFTYVSLQQLLDKYLIQDRATGFIYETPQYAYMNIAAMVFSSYPPDIRLDKVIDYYHAISNHEINLPTPIMAGVRTKQKSYASCALLDLQDNIQSIGATNAAIGMLTAASSGIGLNVGRMRSIGSSIRNGTVIHPGIVPFLKIFEATGKAFSQANRGGKVTVYVPIWNYEIEDIIRLKNNRGTEESSVRHLDYCIQLSGIFYKRFLNNEPITLFSTDDVPGLYEAFGTDKFDELYMHYEKQDIRKKSVLMQKLFLDLVEERSGTARIYIMNIDHANTHSPYEETVCMSNLCVAPETLLLTDKGYIPIGELQDKPVTIWNGEEWSNTIVRKTGVNQKLIKISFKDQNANVHIIECTPYHKFKVQLERFVVEVRAAYLKRGDKIQNYCHPEFELKVKNHQDWLVYDVEDNNRYDNTYCLTEPKRNTMVLNGVLAGNCVEIIQPSRPLNDINDTGVYQYKVAVKKDRIHEFVSLKNNNKFLEFKP
jgi:ribonucleotide reductase alpha subunit